MSSSSSEELFYVRADDISDFLMENRKRYIENKNAKTQNAHHHHLTSRALLTARSPAAAAARLQGRRCNVRNHKRISLKDKSTQKMQEHI